MSKQYHHGNLKQELIHNGLLLLNKEGIDGFSMRKVASMCGVSHNAPYKHFKGKDEFINEIINEVWREFRLALLEVTELYTDDAKLQIVEIGKAYVNFMIENPEYLKFMFLSDSPRSVIIQGDQLPEAKIGAFGVFQESAERYFREINLDKELYMQKTLIMWSMVHGLAILIIKEGFVYNGNVIDLVEKMIRDNIE